MWDNPPPKIPPVWGRITNNHTHRHKPQKAKGTKERDTMKENTNKAESTTREIVTPAAVNARPYYYGLKATMYAVRYLYRGGKAESNGAETMREYYNELCRAAAYVKRMETAAAHYGTKAARYKVRRMSAAAQNAKAAAEKACKAIRAPKNSTPAVKAAKAESRAKVRMKAESKIAKAARANRESAAAVWNDGNIAAYMAGGICCDMVQDAIVAMLTAAPDADILKEGMKAVWRNINAARAQAVKMDYAPAADDDDDNLYIVNLKARDNTETAAECAAVVEWIESYCKGKIPREKAWAAYNGAARNMKALSGAEQKMIERIFAAARAAFTL